MYAHNKEEFSKYCDQEIADLIFIWIEILQYEKKYSLKTINAYIIDMFYFLEFLNKHFNELINISTISKLELKDFRAWLFLRKKRELSAPSTSRAISAIRGFFKYLIKYKHIVSSELFHLYFPKENKKIPKSANIEDVFSSLDEIEKIAKEPWLGKRDKALLTIIYACGLRIQEALSIRKKDFFADAIIVKGKGNKERQIPKLDIINKPVNEYLEYCPHPIMDNDFLFLGKNGEVLNPGVFQRQVRYLRKMLGLSNNITPHSYRHSFATHLLNEGVDIRTIQALLGHKNLSTTQAYTNLDINKLRSEYNKSHPHNS